MRPHHQEKTRRVYADGLHQLSQSHQLTAPSGHLPQFSFLQEIDKLTNNHLQPLRLTCKYLNRGLHPGDVAVMIRSPDIDEMIIASRKLVLMVGNVRREISWSLVAANQNPVLIIAVGYGLQPDGILTSVGFPRILQLLNGLTDGTSLMEGSLTEPGAKGDTKHLQLLPHLLKNSLSDLPDILSLVALIRNIYLQPEQLRVPGGDRPGKHLHLTTIVIHVEFGRHIVPTEPKDSIQGVAVGGVSRVAHVERTGGVHADVFQQDAPQILTLTVTAPNTLSPGQHAQHSLPIRALPQSEINEPRPRHLHILYHVGNHRIGSQILNQP